MSHEANKHPRIKTNRNDLIILRFGLAKKFTKNEYQFRIDRKVLTALKMIASSRNVDRYFSLMNHSIMSKYVNKSQI